MKRKKVKWISIRGEALDHITSQQTNTLSLVKALHKLKNHYRRSEKSITPHFPMKTTTHMILFGDIERSQTPLKRRSPLLGTPFPSSHTSISSQTNNCSSLSLTLHHQLASSPKLQCKYSHGFTRVNFLLIHVRLVMNIQNGSKFSIAKQSHLIVLISVSHKRRQSA